MSFGAMSPGKRAALGYLIVALFLGLCGHYVYANLSDFHFIRDASVPDLALASLLVLAMYLACSYQLGLFLKAFNLRLGFVETVSITMGMILGNLVLPMKGGSGGLAIYLKKRRGLDFQAFAALYGGTGVLVLLVNSTLALLALVALWLESGYFHGPLTVLALLLFGGSLYLSLFPPPIRWRGKGLLGLAFDSARSWRELTRDRRFLLRQFLAILAICLSSTLILFVVYKSFGGRITFFAALITSSLGAISTLAPLTPGSLGVFDAVVIQIPRVLGADSAMCVAAALAYRALCFLWALILGTPGLLFLMRNGQNRGRGETDPASRGQDQ